ncbi:type I-E CRISPR-associated protein Cse2/CasB [Georgenia sp. TF02-10]|uniref:type I-E CRISPR-associated protein Cse2/CasB n=1 Tax=Georgenia sp. TF02-10 TaxID=2917725 RepID=UPI001FA75B7F|nr:type I-E CRISPR-associated protein Cse2/CasB [Georgenia sp. TF02-10]UNX54046.1 type I-E CRISPR-associated protein Cse2/CasB [Georgenia sp. TF02-10]
MPDPTAAPAAPHRPVPVSVRRARTAVGALVATQAGRLQAAALRQDPRARALLAHLRHAVAKEPGTVPEIWAVTQVHPDDRSLPDQPTPEERAAHAALTLFALHQQSRTRAMHQRGEGLGHAVRRLAVARGNEPAVRRRFDAAATAQSFPEALQHLRGLVAQLQDESIPLDYGGLADDLLDLQQPDGARRVRRRWGRQYYAERRTTAPGDLEPTDDRPGNDQGTDHDEEDR